MNCLFATDLHGEASRYRKLFETVRTETPEALFLGGDLMPHGLAPWFDTDGQPGDFMTDFLVPEIIKLRSQLMDRYPEVFLIFGNDDPRSLEPAFVEGENEGLWYVMNQRKKSCGRFTVYGYPFTPPSPFLLKDWEKYDVSRFIGTGCISPEDGARSVPVEPRDARYSTIKDDLIELAGDDDLSSGIFLFHAPPYQSNLDRAALDGKMIDYAPLDVHVGSIAIQRFLEERQPLLSLHGHIHESASMTGEWRDRLGSTHAFSAAHDGKELALIRFDPDHLAGATRELL